MASFSKFSRPETPSRGVITDRDLDIIEAVLRYRFSPASELVRLVGGNRNVTLRRLRLLWEWQLINRFAFPGIRTHSEFIYYLDRQQTLDLLVERWRLKSLHEQMEEEVRLNREADYAGAAVRGQHMKLGFLQHSLMISRMHFMLEMASRDSGGAVGLAAWRQGAELRGNKIEVPEISSRRIEGTNKYVWEEHDVKTQRLPVEPDALFSLNFDDGRVAHFCYEADRGTMPLADMLKKFRAYRAFIKQGRHRGAFGVHPIRAVLIETIDESRARKLMELVESAPVVGQGTQSGLFWFCISPLFTAPTNADNVAQYFLRPDVVLDRNWALPDLTMHALCDAEN
jgi:Replication-relaxation